jgi:hypothetical protein
MKKITRIVTQWLRCGKAILPEAPLPCQISGAGVSRMTVTGATLLISARRVESPLGRGCVKTSIESQFVPRLRNFRNLQFAKALISLKLKFQWPGQVHNSSSSPTFLHSLGQQRTLSGLPDASVTFGVKRLQVRKNAASVNKLEKQRILGAATAPLGRLLWRVVISQRHLR